MWLILTQISFKFVLFFILNSYVQKRQRKRSRHLFWRQGANYIRNQAILGDDRRELAKPSSLMADICDRDEPPNFLRAGRRNSYISQLMVQSRLNGSK